MKKIFFLFAALALLTGCATFDGPIDMDEYPPETTWISPSVQDGENDYLEVRIDLPPYDNLVIREYKIIITDSLHRIVFSSGEKTEKTRKPGIALPDKFIWGGKNSEGNFVKDGTYNYYIEIFYGKSEIYTSPEFKVIVDNTPPSLVVSAALPLFSPNNDGRLDSVRIFQRFSTVEEKWIGTILDASGKQIKTFQWKGLATDLVWDGKDLNDEISEDGIYSYSISSKDKAGNKSTFKLEGITLDTAKAAIELRRDLDSFSPNNDNRKDFLTLKPSAADITNIASWGISIHDRGGKTVRSYTGENELPEQIIFDGKDEEGILLQDGFYKGHLSIVYKNGTRPEGVSGLFEIDNTPPLINLSTEHLLFSPDGDGNLDSIIINQSSSIEESWTGTLLSSNGTVIKTILWKKRALQFAWNGRFQDGTMASDGDYSYRIECTDKADNLTVKELKGIRIDTRTPVISVTTLNKGASPDGDGINDIISFNLKTNIPEEIKSWNLKIIDANDREIKKFVSSNLNTLLPSNIDWNGADEQGNIIENSFSAELEVEYLKGNITSSRIAEPFLIDITGPKLLLQVTPVPFSPDQDGVDEVLNIKASAEDTAGIESWRVQILDPAGNVFKTYYGNGDQKNIIKWNGLSDTNELVQSASDYAVEYTVRDKLGNTAITTATASVDILVLKDGENLKIIISSIYFVPNKADFMSLDEEKIKKNLATLDRLAEILKKYSQYKIRLEGHAVRVYWDNPAKLQTEQTEVLMPLSTERAEVIKEALSQRGISSQRMSTIGYGGNRPVVPHSDLENRWKNRRVEFILIK